MNKTENFQLLELHIPKKEWIEIRKVSIFYSEIIFLKVFLLIDSRFSLHRKYILKVTYKDKSIKNIPISNDQKNLIKPSITSFNFYIGTL
jgi:hypothetical protein